MLNGILGLATSFITHDDIKNQIEIFRNVENIEIIVEKAEMMDRT